MSDDPQPENAVGPQPSQSHRNPLFIILGFAILGLALALLIFGRTLFRSGTDSETAPALEQIPSLTDGDLSIATGNEMLAVGDPAYNFSLQDLDGNEVELEELHGRPVILNFWATWCAPCRIEMPELQAAFEENEPAELAVLAINQEESPEAVAEFFGEMDLTITPLLDSDGTVAKLYGADRVLPASYFISPDGIVTAVHLGPMTQAQIADYLAETVIGNR